MNNENGPVTMNTLLLKQKGVTLIELLIVVLILVVLSTIVVPRISLSVHNAGAKVCCKNIRLINTSIETYWVETGSYPANLRDVTANPAYFPDGEPICPITKQKYPMKLVEKRIDATDHAH